MNHAWSLGKPLSNVQTFVTRPGLDLINPASGRY